MPIAEDGSVVNANFYKKPVSRPLATAIRRFADATSDRIAATASTRQIIATVAVVKTGAARDGNAVVLVRWRGTVATANGYAASYTPVVGHRVVCDFIDSQLFIAYRIVGQP